MMPELSDIAVSELQNQKRDLERRYAEYKGGSLALDMTRGKPCAEQLDLSMGMLAGLTLADIRSVSGTDCRNYGGIDGLPEAKQLLAAFLGVGEAEIIVGGNSSLTLMYEALAHACAHVLPGGVTSWREQGVVKFLCPSPGYDRHFSVCEDLDIEMLTVDMTEQGPDMDAVERLVKDDPAIKGIWLVPKYANPTGVTLSDAVVQRLAQMKCAAPDFRIMWDNAYAVHHLGAAKAPLTNILDACRAAGTENRPLLFGSTSKISFAGAGLSAMAGSTANMAWMRAHLSMMTIGPDKLNQLRHVRFFKDMQGIQRHMLKHAEIIGPKFQAVERVLAKELGGLRLASWNQPTGGYFVNFDTVPGCASRVVELAKAVGVKLTGAGATFPYKKDPRDANLRIAPTLPRLGEIEQAMDVFAICVKLATLERLAR